MKSFRGQYVHVYEDHNKTTMSIPSQLAAFLLAGLATVESPVAAHRELVQGLYSVLVDDEKTHNAGH